VTPILFLAHRIPYPPDKGDKIRSFHLLTFLAERHDVHLGAFVDALEDEEHRARLAAICASTHLPRLHKLHARARSLTGLVAGTPMTVPYYRDAGMRRWVDAAIARHGISRVVVFCSSMAQYVSGERYRSMRRIIDFVDIDSDKWRQYGEARNWPASWIYRRESRTLLAYETAIAREFDRCFFVSEAEADHFRTLAPGPGGNVASLRNGVDLQYFDGRESFANPYPVGARVTVFTGAMDYWANVDAVTWFAERVFPAVRRNDPSARFFIVGSNPSPGVNALAGDGVTVTGRVPDVRPYLQHAQCAVAPLRLARGVQNKVLEALAMGCPVVASSKAAKGIARAGEGHVIVADEPHDYAAAVAQLLVSPRDPARSAAARDFVVENYDWPKNLAAIEDWLSPR